MNRKSFLLSLPLIGGLFKALADKPNSFEGRGWNGGQHPQAYKLISDDGRYKVWETGAADIRKYPLTIDQCYDGSKVFFYQTDEAGMLIRKSGRLEWKNGFGSEVILIEDK